MEQLVGQGKDGEVTPQLCSTNYYFYFFIEGSGGMDIDIFTEELEAKTINILNSLQMF